MKIKNKILLLCLLGLKTATIKPINLTEMSKITEGVITDISYDFINTVVESIPNEKYEKLAEAIIDDFLAIVEKMSLFTNTDINTMYPINIKTEEGLIDAYKEILSYLYIVTENPIFSKETHEKIIYWLFYFAYKLSSKNSNFINENEQFKSIFVIADLFGIKFTCQTYFKDILNTIISNCEFLKNNNLNDIVYELTINKILETVSKKFVEKTNFFNNLTMGISYPTLQKVLEKIKEFSSKQVNSKNDFKMKKTLTKKKSS